MKILVFGGGGREHAIVWALRKNLRVSEIVAAPGNGGLAELARCIPVDQTSLAAMLSLVDSEPFDLVVVGPEVPLAEGIVDALQQRHVAVFGPTKAAAMLETSKAFAKEFMNTWTIPTARCEVCSSMAEVDERLGRFAERLVVKADSLAAGKGVILCDSHEEASEAAREMFAGSVTKLVLEEMLIGPEVSFFAICDGYKAVALATAQDHKRIGEGDKGPNTGGMGAYSTDDLLSPAMSEWVLQSVAQRVVDGMRAEGVTFVGVLFIGLILTDDGPKVLEFNTRFGDPEVEAILLRLETDLLEILEAAVQGRIGEVEIRLKQGASACVVAASGGYPGTYETGKKIAGLGDIRDVEVFHAGTKRVGQHILTAGGRVLAVSAVGENLQTALGLCYAALSSISFDGMYFRRDIGWQALRYKDEKG